jgi:phenylalanyl-tRNA synthetase beta chain
MPTISVNRELLFDYIGQKFSMNKCLKCLFPKIYSILIFVADEKFDELCFEFGIELDDVVSEPSKTKPGTEEIQYKIEIPANRYDMLCVEGLSRALAIFLKK